MWISGVLLLSTAALWHHHTHHPPLACSQVKQTLLRQRAVLHSGTPGDNITVAVVSLRPLPQLPRHSSSRLNLRAALPEDGRASPPSAHT